MINENGSGFAICHFNGEEIIIGGESVIMFELKNNMNKLSKRLEVNLNVLNYFKGVFNWRYC